MKKKYLELIRSEFNKTLRNSFSISIINMTKIMDHIQKDVDDSNIKECMRLNIAILDKFDDLYHRLIQELDRFIERS